MTEMTFDWVPNVAVGPLKFGELVSPHVESGLLEFCADLSNDSDCFVLAGKNDPAVYTNEKGAIDDILTDQKLVFRGQNLIGMRIEAVVDLLGQEPEELSEPIELDDDVQVSAEFDSLGLQLWLRDGVAVSAVVGEVVED